jgi:two-component system, chemotaxis family, CheB/CheR fusion protein
MHAILDRQVEHLVRIVDDLMDIQRISRMQITLRRAPLDLVELVASTLEAHRAGFETCGIALGLDPPAAPLYVVGDVTRLVQVLENLLGNALKFTPRGGRTSVALVRDGDFAELRVHDNGIGIEREVLDQLFTPFTQARQPLDRTAGGLGLGLALVKGLVELHGGSVAVASDGPGTGTVVNVRLPLGDIAPRTEPAAQPRRGERRRILIIEDNRDAAETLQHMLESDGHEVRVAHDGATGLAAGREFLPEIVFCDLGLPEMSGYDICRAFRADEVLSRVVLVALSGYAQPDDRERAATAGFRSHVAKPPTRHDLERAMEALPRPE